MLAITYIVVLNASLKLATKIDAIPKPCNTKPVMIVLNRDSMGKNDVGPIKQKPHAIKQLPISADILGFKHLSTIQPQNGAVTAYTAPFIMKIDPNEIGLRSNWRKCGSSVAPKNPIDMLVAMMLNELTMTPGILMIDDILTEIKIGRLVIRNSLFVIRRKRRYLLFDLVDNYHCFSVRCTWLGRPRQTEANLSSQMVSNIHRMNRGCRRPWGQQSILNRKMFPRRPRRKLKKLL